jgi:LPS export ABC transporter protein LptC
MILFKKYLLYIVFISTTLISCKEDVAEINTISKDRLNIEEVKEPEIIYSDSAQVKVRITGPFMLYYNENVGTKQEFTQGVKAYFFDANQQQQSVLSGKYAIRDDNKKQVIVRDSVVWESVTDGRLETSELIWDEKTNIIRSTKYTTIRRKNEFIHGFNFETDDKLTHWRILSPKGILKVEELEKQLQ